VPNDSSNGHSGRVELWTNHRVMDWLRQVDLSEYAPNLRGSGVHGALMVYEPRYLSLLKKIIIIKKVNLAINQNLQLLDLTMNF